MTIKQSTPTINDAIDDLIAEVACYFFNVRPSNYWKEAAASQHEEAMEKSRIALNSLLLKTQVVGAEALAKQLKEDEPLNLDHLNRYIDVTLEALKKQVGSK